MKSIVILISGRGSNMVGLVDAMRDGRVPADPVVVISNVPGAAGLATAAGRGIATSVVDHTAIKPRQAHERAVLEILNAHLSHHPQPPRSLRALARCAPPFAMASAR